MNPTSPWLAAALTLLAFAVSAILVRVFGSPPAGHRYASIDGLRGFLAFFVFLHHVAVWHFYVRTGVWEVPASHLFAHLGQGGVAMFFMITGFLFWGKLLDSRSGSVDWWRLYVSRVLRLTPLYLFAMAVLVVLGAYVSGFTLHEPVGELAINAMRWLTFTLTGAPDVNGIPNTFTLIAGVTWSLKYEWLFYLMLPILGLLLRVSVPLPYVALGVATLAATAVVRPDPIHLAAFAGGILAAYAARSPSLCAHLRKAWASIVAVACVALVVVVFRNSEIPAALALLTVPFVIIACGNSLGGLLTTAPARMLGEMSYGIYLLHGIVLFVAFRLVIGFDASAELTTGQHWAVAAACVPVVVLVSFAAFKLIEEPAINATSAIAASLRRRFARAPAIGAEKSENA